MTEPDKLTWGQVRVALQEFCAEIYSQHGIVDLISPNEYEVTRRKLSHLIDDLAYPTPSLQYNDEETEWNDVSDTVDSTIEDAGREHEDHEEIDRDLLLWLKAELLRNLDEMTEK